MADSKRRPPYFPCYASDWMARERYLLMPLTQRGLLFSMLNAAWVNDSIPADPVALALILRADPEEVRSALSKGVLQYFAPLEGHPDRLTCPELDQQRAAMAERQRKQAEGGAKGGRVTQMRARSKEQGGQPSIQAPSLAKGSDMNCDEVDGAEMKRNASIEDDNHLAEHREWLREYEGD